MDHSYYFGRSGSGKSSLMLHHAIDAITAGRGLFFLDPHGPDITKLLDYIPPRRRPDVIYFDPTHKPVSFNPLDRVTNPDQTAEALLYAFRDIWRFGKASTPVFDEYVLHGFLTLLQIPRSTVLHLRPLLTSESYRAEVVPKLTDPYLQSFWHEFEALTPKEKRDEIRSTKNKINSVIADSRLRAILGQGKSAFTMADVLKGKIFLARLPQGELGLQKTRLLGMLLLTQLHVAALSRKGTTPFEVFIDEVHHFQGTALMEMLSGIRKFGVTLAPVPPVCPPARARCAGRHDRQHRAQVPFPNEQAGRRFLRRDGCVAKAQHYAPARDATVPLPQRNRGARRPAIAKAAVQGCKEHRRLQ